MMMTTQVFRAQPPGKPLSPHGKIEQLVSDLRVTCLGTVGTEIRFQRLPKCKLSQQDALKVISERLAASPEIVAALRDSVDRIRVY